MKKMKTYILGMVLAFAMILLPQNVSAATQIPVTAVEDITDVMAVGSTNIKVPTGEYSNLVQFSLNKPSYVYVSAYSTVMHEDYDSLGAIEEFAVYSDANCSNLVTGDEVTVVWGNERKSKYLCLDAGNYWICFAKTKNGSYNDDSYGEFRLSVAAQYLNVTGTKNGSWGRAKQITTDKKVTGFLSSNTRKSWFKFKVSGDTTARLNLSLENPLGESVFESSKTGVTLYRSNHNVLERMNIAENYYSSACSKEVTLKSGTYYIEIAGSEAYKDSWDPTKLKKTGVNNMGVVNLKITTVKKTKISKLSNVKGKKAQVTYNKVSNAKGYEIQYSTDKKFKKGVKVKKANAKTTKVTLTKLTKGKKYYVRVRAYRVDEDDNRVNGSWSEAKSVKITK